MRFRIRNKEGNGWHIVSTVNINQKNKELFNSLSGKVPDFRTLLVVLDVLGVSNINDSLQKIHEGLNKNEIEYDPVASKQDKKGFFHKVFK